MLRLRVVSCGGNPAKEKPFRFRTEDGLDVAGPPPLFLKRGKAVGGRHPISYADALYYWCPSTTESEGIHIIEQ